MKKQDLISQITEFNNTLDNSIPPVNNVHNWLESLTEILFPGNRCKKLIQKDLSIELIEIKDDLLEILKLNNKMSYKSRKAFVKSYFEQMIQIFETLKKDAMSILEYDPAARSIEEIIYTYPGFYAIMVYRLSHPFYENDMTMLARILSEYAHQLTGIDIHPGAKIGASFFIDHGTGIVIGETTEIGENVKIYQGVTLGAINVKKELAKIKRHPTIENNVIIYSGATILGGNTVIGKNSIIGGNVWMTKSTEPYSVVYHKNQVQIQNKSQVKEPINYFI